MLRLNNGMESWQEVTPVLRLHALYAVLQVDNGGSREGSERTTA